MLFSKPSKAVGVDIGTHSVKAVQFTKAGGRLRAEEAGYALVDRNQLNVDPIAAQADAMREAVRHMDLAHSVVVGAIPGQNVVIRYPRMPDMRDDELTASIEAEAGQNIPYDLSEVFLDWALLDKVTENEETMLRVILVAAKHEVIETRVQIAELAEVQYSVLGVDSLALSDGAESCDFLRVGESVALVNMGASSTSIHFIKDGLSNFIRDVSWGARELIQAIAKGRHCEYAEAENMLARAGEEAESPPADAPPPVPEPEQPAQAESGLDDLGSGSLLDPLDDELGDLGEPAPAASSSMIGAGRSEEKSLNELLESPLTRLVTEIRRSFDYYEQQLYERPVDRLILSGGVAQLPALPDILGEELGLDQVEVANPASSALLTGSSASLGMLREKPAQFMVAVGLAARGAIEL